MTFTVVVLIAEAAFAAFTCVYSLVSPAHFAAQLGLNFSSAAGRNEIRAQYGGFFGAVALTQFSAAMEWAPTDTGLGLGAIVFGGLIWGRLVATALNRGVTGYTMAIKALLVVDLLAFGLCVAALALAAP